jgi:hypothetical protein
MNAVQQGLGRLTPIPAMRAKARLLLRVKRISANRISEVWEPLRPYCQVRIPNGTRIETFPERLPPLKAIRHACVCRQPLQALARRKAQWRAIMFELSRQLRAAIELSGERQSDLARGCGISPSSVSRFISGKSDLSPQAMDRLTKYLNLRLVSI